MLNTVFFKFIVGITVALGILFQPALSYAWTGHRDHRYPYHDRREFGMMIDLVPHNSRLIMVGGSRYYYDGAYYTPARNGYILVAPPVGAIIPMLPPYFEPVVINGIVYYTDGGVYYISTRYGYQVVQAPLVQRIADPVIVTRTVPLAPEPQNQTKVAEGIGLGGIIGALTGGIIGHQMKGHHELGGALIGGAIGATAGGIAGAQIPHENASRTTVIETVSVPAQQSIPVSAVVPAAPVVTPVPADEAFTLNIPNEQGSGYVTVIIKRSGTGFTGPQGEYYPEFPKVTQLQAMYSKTVR